VDLTKKLIINNVMIRLLSCHL